MRPTDVLGYVILYTNIKIIHETPQHFFGPRAVFRDIT